MKMKLIKEKEYKDGSARYKFDVDKDFENGVKTFYGKKRYTENLGKRFILEALYQEMKRHLLRELEENHKEALKLNNLKPQKRG